MREFRVFKKRKYLQFLPAFLLLIPTCAHGQYTKEICGTYTYYAPENITLEEARQTALQRARLTALADEFGTYITQNNVTQIKNENEKSDLNFYSLSESEVKGEWLKDTNNPEYAISYEENMLMVKASICGMARKIITTEIDFKAHILCNGTELRFESDCFKSGDDFYLSFSSPTDGYLAIYLVDTEKSAYCLLPYRKVTDGKVPVKANHDYIFFSKDATEAPSDASIVDQYTLYCKKETEINYLYIIFSQKPFIKANDRATKVAVNGLILPRELPFSEFQKWLTKNRMRDKYMQTEIRSITINKK